MAFTSYLTLAALFAGLYALDPTGMGVGLTEAREGHWGDVFFFSVQTISTIGYGRMSPVSLWANCVSVVESFCGIVYTAIVTGSLFAKLSRPVARIAFARRVLLEKNAQGTWDLVFRIVNQRRTPILNMQPTVSVLIRTGGAGNQAAFAYRNLDVDVTTISLFVGGARLRHTIDPSSPIYGMTSPDDAARLGIYSFLAIVQVDGWPLAWPPHAPSKWPLDSRHVLTLIRR